MKSFAIAALAAVSTAKVLSQEYSNFVGFIAKHGKAYATLEEYNLRYDIYMKLDAEIRHLNITEKSSRHGHNFLSDFTREEYTARLGLKGMKLPKKSENVFQVTGELNLAASVDWRTVTPAVVNPVKDQGQCGSCWAFASTAVMESAHAIYEGVLLSLSEQQLVSCSFLFGNLGCNGGWYYDAWKYALTKPLETEANYPYTSGTSMKAGSCAYVSSKGVVATTGQTSVATDTNSIMVAISQQP